MHEVKHLQQALLTGGLSRSGARGMLREGASNDQDRMPMETSLFSTLLRFDDQMLSRLPEWSHFFLIQESGLGQTIELVQCSN